jgi:UDP-N-acetyl-D-galactosamine dehydrogenase
MEEYGIALAPLELFREFDAIILAVPHRAYRLMGETQLAAMLTRTGVLVDIKSVLEPSCFRAGHLYWSL